LILGERHRYVLKLPPLRPVAGLVHLLNVPLAMFAGLAAAFSARRRGAQAIVTSFDGGFSQIAAAVAARVSGKPLVVLVFDLWEENAYSVVERGLARIMERRILTQAAAVVVFCEAAREHYRLKHGILAEVLEIPIDAVADRSPAAEPGSAETGGGVDVLVAGAIYWAQEDAIRRLCEAARDVDGASITIMGDEALLRARGIVADRYEPRLSGAGFLRRVASADVLFVGLSLRSPYPDVVRTATPARLVEYMASRRPLLVHAPAGSHVAEYARREDFAEVVDEPDVQALATGLRRVLSDSTLAAERLERARRLALTRHDTRVVRDALTAIFEGVDARST